MIGTSTRFVRKPGRVWLPNGIKSLPLEFPMRHAAASRACAAVHPKAKWCCSSVRSRAMVRLTGCIALLRPGRCGRSDGGVRTGFNPALARFMDPVSFGGLPSLLEGIHNPLNLSQIGLPRSISGGGTTLSRLLGCNPMALMNQSTFPWRSLRFGTQT